MSMSAELKKALSGLGRSVRNVASRGVVRMVSSALKMQGLQVSVLKGEVLDGVEHAEGYGLTAHPQLGAEAFLLHLGGDRSHAVAISVCDRRYRPTDLQAGEVCLYDDLKQRVHLTRQGIVIDGAGLPVIIKNSPEVFADTPLLKVSGEILDNCASSGQTMSAMRAVYNAHTHPENNSVTEAPSQKMGG